MCKLCHREYQRKWITAKRRSTGNPGNFVESRVKPMSEYDVDDFNQDVEFGG